MQALYAAHVAHLADAYARAAASVGVDVVVLHAGTPQLRDRFDDQHHPFRPTPAFAHWIPLLEPDALVILGDGPRPKLVRPRIDDFWEAPPPAPPDWVLAPFDVVTTREVRAARVAVISSTPPVWADPAHTNPPALLAALDEVRTRKT